MHVTNSKATSQVEIEVLEPVCDGSALVEITVVRGKRRQARRYWVDPVHSDFGVAVVFTKKDFDPSSVEDAVYRACVEPDGTGHCECLGFSKYGWCKHCTAIATLIDEGVL